MKTSIRSPSARLLAVQARLEALPRKAITAEQAKAQGTQHLAEAGAGMLKQAAGPQAKRQALATPAGACRLPAARTRFVESGRDFSAGMERRSTVLFSNSNALLWHQDRKHREVKRLPQIAKAVSFSEEGTSAVEKADSHIGKAISLSKEGTSSAGKGSSHFEKAISSTERGSSEIERRASPSGAFRWGTLHLPLARRRGNRVKL